MKRELIKTLSRNFLLITVCLVLAILTLSEKRVEAADMYDTKYGSKIYYSGVYKKKIGKKYYYISMNSYTDIGKYKGCFYIYDSKKRYKQDKYLKKGQFYEVGKNKYLYRKSNNTLLFKVYKNKMILLQKGKIVKGSKLNGTFKLVKRYPRS